MCTLFLVKGLLTSLTSIVVIKMIFGSKLNVINAFEKLFFQIFPQIYETRRKTADILNK